MADESKHPHLRVVSPSDAPTEESSPRPAAPSSPVVDARPSEGTNAYVALLGEVDTTVPLGAAFVVCTGCYLADAALDFYHSAVARVAPGTFRNDLPPGLRAAESTRAWLGSHLSAVKELAEKSPVPDYARAKDLTDAAEMAASDLDRATATAKSAGLWFDERAAHRFADAQEDLRAILAYLQQPGTTDDALVEDCEDKDIYILGLDALAGV